MVTLGQVLFIAGLVGMVRWIWVQRTRVGFEDAKKQACKILQSVQSELFDKTPRELAFGPSNTVLRAQSASYTHAASLIRGMSQGS